MWMWKLGEEIGIQAVPNMMGIADFPNSEGVTTKAQVDSSSRVKNFITNVSCYHFSDGVGQKSKIRAGKPD